MADTIATIILGVLLIMSTVQRGKLTARQIEAMNLIAGPQRHTMLEGGSGSGKTFVGLDVVVVRALLAPKSSHAILRERFNHAKLSVWMNTLPRLMETRFPTVPCEYNKSDFFLEFTNGARIWIGGLDDKDRVDKVLGQDHCTLYFNECSQITWNAVETALTRLRLQCPKVVDGKPTGKNLRLKAIYDQNPASVKHWAYSVFHKKVNPEDGTKLSDPENYANLLMHPKDNLANLDADYLKSLQNLSARKRKRFWEGQYSDDVEGALWTSAMIAATRILEKPQCRKVAVGVDPAVSHNPKSNETGIITAGLAGDHIYNWRDDSCVATPGGWARRAIIAYMEEQADAIVAEKNQGGDLVEENIRNTARNMGVPVPRVVLVHAARGKYTRAEPIAALMESDPQTGSYNKARDHIVGEMPDLEGELTGWSPSEDEDSPNRLDAKVWASHWLLGTHKTAGTWGTRDLHQQNAGVKFIRKRK